MKYLIIIIPLLSITLHTHAQTTHALDDIVQRKTVTERKVLQPAPIREADIFWEKRIWRLIDVREKMNQAFMYPEAPFFDILSKAALEGDLTLYDAEDEKFTRALSKEEIDEVMFEIDTVPITDLETGEVILKVIKNEIFYEDIKRFRIKEVWYFDEQRGSLQVRILGIAPIIEVYGEAGEFRYEQPLFWIHYPSSREVLARHPVFVVGNDAAMTSWEDIFEMRYFASTIYKASNIRDQRIQDYANGLDALLEADKIKKELFNYEHDLWSY